MAAKTTASFISCFSFLKEALVLPMRNPKLFTPVFLLLTVVTFLVPVIDELTIEPLTADMARHAIENKNTDPSSAEYARFLEEGKQESRELVLIAFVFVSVILDFVKQIVAFFAASTTYTGDRYSLTELLLKVIKGNLKGPFITIAVVTILEFTCMVLLDAPLSVMMMLHSEVISVQGFVLLLACLAFLYFNVVSLVSIVVSVADKGCRGMRALRQAWRLMTNVRRKEGFVLVVVIHVLRTVLNLLYKFSLRYTWKSTALWLCLLSVYALLSGAEQLYNFAAATVYYYEAMDTKQVMACDYGRIPSGEASV